MNKILIVALILLVLLGLVAFLVTNLKKGTSSEPAMTVSKAVYKKISPQEAKEMMDKDPSAIVLDVRTPAEFAEGHISKALNIANETIGSDKPEGLPDLDAKILVYCRSGNRSAQTAKKLVAMGYTQVYDFGGLNTWSYGTVK
ncbi:Rhodanese-related sulfurtransferase [Sphaerochaeta pleomorpha str. Grapes]|uniref:Rhodanese-related sulfurtransferase n=1 Tax=Sphaerochaeta pleomorpha (strain ATCC BAA-1885 / DSM 22778 / Grapes) TaxID=158190 RepID=G8QQ95_SPHPG|nr:rhodanese-like domain-containing protein [Sphaerochaeta pleomorpha]AEV28672.1 Rhodanese-related sulfurtransferase [Sphaerochaeta pleomorpha str. Grapes]